MNRVPGKMSFIHAEGIRLARRLARSWPMASWRFGSAVRVRPEITVTPVEPGLMERQQAARSAPRRLRSRPARMVSRSAPRLRDLVSESSARPTPPRILVRLEKHEDLLRRIGSD